VCEFCVVMLLTVMDGVQSVTVISWTECRLLIIKVNVRECCAVMLLTVMDCVHSCTVGFCSDFRVLVVNIKCV
jgi:hypothetical protein